MIVLDYYKGGTRIIIRDDSCCAKHEEDGILKRIGEIATRALCAKEQKEKTA